MSGTFVTASVWYNGLAVVPMRKLLFSIEIEDSISRAVERTRSMPTFRMAFSRAALGSAGRNLARNAL